VGDRVSGLRIGRSARAAVVPCQGRSEMAELAVVDHSADRLDYAVGHVELDHADHAPFGVVYHGARRAVDPGRPGAAEEPVRAEQADEQAFDALRPASGFQATCALPLPSRWSGAPGASMPGSVFMSPPGSATLDLLARLVTEGTGWAANRCSRPFTVSIKVPFAVSVCGHSGPRRAGGRAGSGGRGGVVVVSLSRLRCPRRWRCGRRIRRRWFSRRRRRPGVRWWRGG